MIISYEHKYLFIEVPKTGTTSISRAIRESDLTARNTLILDDGRECHMQNTHVTANEMKDLLGARYNEFYVFAVRRNEKERKHSLYRFYRYGRARGVMFKKRFKLRRGVNVILANLLPYMVWARVRSQLPCDHYLNDDHGNCLVDDVGDYEDLGSWWAEVREKIGLRDVELPHDNRT